MQKNTPAITTLEEAMRIRALPPVYSYPPATNQERMDRMQDPQVIEQSNLKSAAEAFICEEMMRYAKQADERIANGESREEVTRWIMQKQVELQPTRNPLDDTMSILMDAERKRVKPGL